MNGFTPVEERILRILSDGNPHPPNKLLACLGDPELGSLANVRVWICRLRKKLPPGEEIVCRSIKGRLVGYQHVIRITAKY